MANLALQGGIQEGGIEHKNIIILVCTVIAQNYWQICHAHATCDLLRAVQLTIALRKCVTDCYNIIFIKSQQ